MNTSQYDFVFGLDLIRSMNEFDRSLADFLDEDGLDDNVESQNAAVSPCFLIFDFEFYDKWIFDHLFVFLIWITI